MVIKYSWYQNKIWVLNSGHFTVLLKNLKERQEIENEKTGELSGQTNKNIFFKKYIYLLF